MKDPTPSVEMRTLGLQMLDLGAGWAYAL
ncbi:hypothetical protein EMIT0P258_50053 [Pseudomonas sp. IT-P258]